MSQSKTLLDRLTSFVFGDSPDSTLDEQDLELIQSLHQKVDALSRRLNGTGPTGEATAAPQTQEALDDLAKQVRKLAKTQFKTNTLQESQLDQQQSTLDMLQQAMGHQEELVAKLAQQREEAVAAAKMELLQSLLPALDSLDAAFGSGRRQVLQLEMSRDVRRAVIAWLDGIRLARMRLLDLLAAHDIHPIPTVGERFDPHYHIAVATDTSGRAPDGTIVSQDRPGYTSPTKILREAEVVVARSK